MEIKGAVIPRAEIKKVLELVRERHRSHLRPGDVVDMEGIVSHGEANVTCTLSDPDETDVLTLEARCDLVENDLQNPIDGKNACFDLLDMALSEYLASGREWRPLLEWGREVHDGLILWLRGSVRNLSVERMTEEFLAEHES